MEEKIKISELDDRTLKNILMRECDKFGFDHKDFFVKISNRKVWGRTGVYRYQKPIKISKNTERYFKIIELYEHTCKTLGNLLKTFNHELLHANGIGHREMFDHHHSDY